MAKRVENRRVFELVEDEFDTDYTANQNDLQFVPHISFVYSLDSVVSYPPTRRLYLQKLGNTRYRWAGWTNARVAVDSPLPADEWQAGCITAGTTTSTTEDQVIAWSSNAFAVASDFLKPPRILGRPRFTGLFGVASSHAVGTATLTKIEVVLVEYDSNNVLIKNLAWKESEAVNIVANGASGDTEVKKSITVIFDEVDARMDSISNKLGIQVAVWGKTGNAAHTTTCKHYFYPSSNDSYLDIPFV